MFCCSLFWLLPSIFSTINNKFNFFFKTFAIPRFNIIHVYQSKTNMLVKVKNPIWKECKNLKNWEIKWNTRTFNREVWSVLRKSLYLCLASYTYHVGNQNLDWKKRGTMSNYIARNQLKQLIGFWCHFKTMSSELQSNLIICFITLPYSLLVDMIKCLSCVFCPFFLLIG